MNTSHPLKLSPQQTRLLRLRAQRLLLDRAPAASLPSQVVEEVFALQAQELPAALLSLRARSTGLRAAAVEQALQTERTLAWTWCLRGTLHLLTAADARWLVPLLGPQLRASGQRRLEQLGWDELRLAAGLRLVQAALQEHSLLYSSQVAELLSASDLPSTGQAPFHLLYHAAQEGILCRGLDHDGHPAYLPFDAWLGLPEPLPRAEALARLARRYLEAYAPAGPVDLAYWSGLKISEARAAWELLSSQVAPVDAAGRPAWILKFQLDWLDDLDEEKYDSAPVVRLLPRYDTSLLGYADRSLAVPPAYARRVHPGGGILHPVVLVNGLAAGIWKTRRRKGRLEILVEPFEDINEEVRQGITAEVNDIARFLDEEAVWTE